MCRDGGRLKSIYVGLTPPPGIPRSVYRDLLRRFRRVEELHRLGLRLEEEISRLEEDIRSLLNTLGGDVVEGGVQVREVREGHS